MKILAEYKVLSDRREQFFVYVEQLRRTYANVRVYEGVRQPGLFVEEWEGCEEAFFDALIEERNEPNHPLWSQLHDVVDGGRVKVHTWLFCEVE